MIKNRIKSGFNELDKFLMSFEPGKLYLIAGRPGMGKTSLMLDLVLNIAQQTPVHIFSLESSTEYLLKRLSKKTESIDNLPIYIYDNCLEIEQITKKIETNVKDGIIFIDYMQLINPEYEATTTLKYLAIQAKVPVVVFSQLKRTADRRGEEGSFPVLEDIPYVGDRIFDEVDTYMFLYRKAYYNEGRGGDEAKLQVIKRYIGSTGTATLHFDGKTGTFYE